jgi:hypothetical protein
MPWAKCVKTCFDTPRGILYPEGTVIEDLPVNSDISVHFVGKDGKPIRLRPAMPKIKKGPTVVEEIGNIRKAPMQAEKEA